MGSSAPQTEIEDVHCTGETAKAICVRIEGVRHWIPKAVLGMDNEVNAEGESGTLHVATWFAEKEGLG